MSRYYSKSHYQRLSNGGPDSPEAALERIRHRQIGEQAHREMLETFAPLGPHNAQQAMDWQAARIRELTGIAETGRIDEC